MPYPSVVPDHVGSPVFYVDRGTGTESNAAATSTTSTTSTSTSSHHRYVLYVGSGMVHFQYQFLLLSKKHETHPLRIADKTSMDEWRECFALLAEALPTLSKIVFVWETDANFANVDFALRDEHVTAALEYFPRIAHLEFRGCPEFVPGRRFDRTVRWIETKLSDLEALSLFGGGAADMVRSETMAGLPRLREIRVDEATNGTKLPAVPFSAYLKQHPHWLEFLKAVRSNPNLATIDIPEHMSGFVDLQFWPRIHEARRRYRTDVDNEEPCGRVQRTTTTPTLESWIDALVAVQDRFDCFHYLFTEMVPEVFLPCTPI